MAAIDRILAPLDRTLGIVETAGMAVLTLTALGLGVMQIVLRYVFNTGFAWSEGIFITLTVWAMLLAGSRAVRDCIHVRVDIGIRYLPRRLKRGAELVSLVLPMVLCGYFFYAGFLYTTFVHDLGIVSPEARIPDWMIYGSVPVTMAAFTLRYLLLVVGWFRGEEQPGISPEAKS